MGALAQVRRVARPHFCSEDKSRAHLHPVHQVPLEFSHSGRSRRRARMLRRTQKTPRANADSMSQVGFVHIVAGAFVAATLLVACGSSPTTGQTGAAQTTVSWKNDVLPIFATNCSTTSACHGSPTGIEVFLAGGSGNATTIHAGIVGVDSAELPTMPYVTAGDATKSYLMHKLDGDEGQFDAECVGGDCGLQMPREETPLDAATRNTIRTWITQGALDN